MNKLNQIAREINEVCAAKEALYKQSRARGTDLCTAHLFDRRIQRLIRKYGREAEKGVDINGR